MPVIIKEIHVSTVVEKKVILPGDISDRTYEHIKEKVLAELSERDTYVPIERGRKER